MTDTLQRPARPRLPARAARPGLLRAGLPAAAWALIAGLVVVAVPVLTLWAADSRSSAGVGSALRAVVQVWLLGHGASLHHAGGTFSLTPLALLALPLLLLERAARHAAGQHSVGTVGEAVRLSAGVAGPYALGVTAVAGLAGGGVQAGATQALLGASVLGLLGACTGVLRGAGLGPGLVGRLPVRLRRVTRPAAAAVLVLLAAGALLVGGQLVLHLARARELAGASAPGVVGGVGLLLIGVLYAPGAAVWGASYLAGPGFAVGVGTAVGPFGVTLGPVPALPLLAALPGGPLPAGVGVLALAGPLAAGLVAGVLSRRCGAGLLDTVLAGPIAGLALCVLAALSSGGFGDGRLAQLGPTWWQVGLAVAAEVSAGAAAWWGVSHWRAARRQRHEVA